LDFCKIEISSFGNGDKVTLYSELVMKVYVGTFEDEKEAQEVVKELSRIGVRTEVKPLLDVEMEVSSYIEGRLSDLKEKCKGTSLEGVMKKWEKFFSIARDKMKEGIDMGEFNRSVLDEIMPERKLVPSPEDLIGKEKLESIKEVTDEEKIKLAKDIFAKMDRDIIERFTKQAEIDMYIINDLHEMLEMNGIEYRDGKMYGKIPSDPRLRIYLSPEEDEEKLETKEEYEIYMERKFDVYTNLVDVYLEAKKVSRLCTEKPYLAKLLIVADVIGEILGKIRGKTDLEKFVESVKTVERENESIFLTDDAIHDILKTLEKEKMVKIKKGMIKIEA